MLKKLSPFVLVLVGCPAILCFSLAPLGSTKIEAKGSIDPLG